MISSQAPTSQAEPMLPRPFQIVSRSLETSDTVTLVLEDREDREITFAPGQFMMMYVFGIGEVPISIAGNPHMGRVLVHTVRAVGAVTSALFDLAPGDIVGIRGPYGSGWPMKSASGRDLLIIAGGIGIAPLRPAVIDALNERADFRDLSLLYGARTPEDLLYQEDLLGWESSPEIKVEVTVDRAASDWRGDVGLVTTLLPRVSFEPESTTAFVCGPEVMMRVVSRELRDRGVPAQDIHISIERNMKCAIGFCGHCQYGPEFICKTGPVGSYARFAARLGVREI